MKSRLRALALVLTTTVLLLPARSMACAVCFGDPDAPMAKGLTWAIVALGGMIAAVLATVVCFFVYIVRRSSRILVNNGAAAEFQRNA